MTALESETGSDIDLFIDDSTERMIGAMRVTPRTGPGSDFRDPGPAVRAVCFLLRRGKLMLN